MAIHLLTRRPQLSRRSLIMIGLVFIQVLLMSAAFVGGRMMAEQNQRSGGQLSNAQLPSQLPKDSAAGSGTVQTIQDNVITLSQGGGFGGGPGGPPGPGGSGGGASSTSEIQVTVTAETKYYKGTSSGMPGMPGDPGGGQTTAQVQEATLADVKMGNQLMVWGIKNGSRIAAEVVYIQSQPFGP